MKTIQTSLLIDGFLISALVGSLMRWPVVLAFLVCSAIGIFFG